MKIAEKDKLIVELHNNGSSIEDICLRTGYRKSKVYQTIQQHRNGNVPEYRVRGRKKGEKTVIPNSIYEKVVTTRPPQGVWDVKKITTLIEEENIVVSLNTVKNFMKKHGFVSHNIQQPFTIEIRRFNDQLLTPPFEGYLLMTRNAKGEVKFILYKHSPFNEVTEYLWRFIKRLNDEATIQNISVVCYDDIDTGTDVRETWENLNEVNKCKVPIPKIRKATINDE